MKGTAKCKDYLLNSSSTYLGVSDVLLSFTFSRQFFQKYKLWPTLIGSCWDQRTGLTGRFPALLWREQISFLHSERSTEFETEPINVTRKRKRSSDVSNVSEKRSNCGEDSSQPPESDRDNGRSSLSLSSPIIFIIESFYDRALNLFSLPVQPRVAGFHHHDTRLPSTDDIQEQEQAVATTISSTDNTLQRLSFSDKVFRGLQNHGFFIGPGDIYGGDYTLYRAGDPSNSHSIATVRLSRHAKLTARELLSFSRVQNQVAKSAIIAFHQSEQDDINTGGDDSNVGGEDCGMLFGERKEEEQPSLSSNAVSLIVINFRSVSERI